ncbi:MAG: SMP-30/gluconolactonase/LRE family protein [Rhodospirillales bacterium]
MRTNCFAALCVLVSLALGAAAQPAGAGKILRVDPALDELIPRSAVIEKLVEGFAFSEGPVWTREKYLLFSDIPRNVIMKWSPGGQVSVFRERSGYDGVAPPRSQFGSNGLTLDKQGRLIICEHGNARVTRLEKDGSVTVLASHYEGKRLNSPNDAVYKSDGSLYFTDPPYGLLQQDADPKKQLKINGIYRLAKGKLQLLYSEMTRPNGLAFSPDEKYLYVANSDEKRKLWMRFEVTPDGMLANPTVFFDVSNETADGLPDGLKVDRRGNVYATGPGGVWVISPEGKHLGTIQPPQPPANCAWGDSDGRTLYMTARSGLYRIRLVVGGTLP